MNNLTEPKPKLRIIELLIENFKNITIAEITPTGGTILITGENGAGKSAVIDSFWMALDLKGAMKENPDPIKHGKKSAKVVVDLGKYIVTRTWTETKSYLKIENAEGAVFKGPSAMLATLIGELSFDPQAFTMMVEKEQLDTLINTLDLSIDIPLLDSERAQLYSDRTLVNRDITALKGQRDGIVIPDGVPDDEDSTANIMTDYQAASDLIVTNNEIRAALALSIRSAELTEADIVKTRIQLNEEEQELAGYVLQVKELTAKVKELSDPDLEAFKCQLEDLEESNKLVRKKQEQQVIIDKLGQQTKASDGITLAIENIDDQKADAIKNASMPVPGLSFDETGVLYNNVPLKGCSAAEQLKVSVGIAMVLNPQIRIIRITDGSLLDEHNMKIIEEMAEEHDFQIWVERVQSDNKVGIFIQEGEVTHDNYKDPQ